jgi:lipopolysaccharide/colanic/teichoic acid biosynthesis glycosyltransferase
LPEPLTLIGVGAGVLTVLWQLARRYFEAAKEIFDILMGVVFGILALPLLAVCAAIIRLSSKGPVLFTQIRVGKDGHPFRMYKLRTMYIDAEAKSGPAWARRDDPRVVPACRWMRRSHVDELPQLLNIIRGEMSLVGPRPERPEILAELEKAYPEVRRRHAVKPGITGLAQVRAGYDTTVDAFRRKLHHDLEYIKKRRWRNELKILTSTLSKVYDRSAH